MDNYTLGPDLCPSCGKVLYPVVKLRPVPALSRAAWFFLLVGLCSSAALYLLGIFTIAIWFRGMLFHGMPLIIGWFVVALIPGILIGIFAYSLPRTCTLNCRWCGWSSIITHYRTGHLNAGEVYEDQL